MVNRCKVSIPHIIVSSFGERLKKNLAHKLFWYDLPETFTAIGILQLLHNTFLKQTYNITINVVEKNNFSVNC